MRILVAGGSGVIGKILIPKLLARGHEISTFSRSPERLEALRQAGAHTFTLDVFDAEGVAEIINAVKPQVVVDQLTQIPGRIDPRRIAQDFAATNRLRTEGTSNLVLAAKDSDVERFITQSIAFAYTPNSEHPAKESEPLDHDAPGGFKEIANAISEHERIVLDAFGERGVVLRYGTFYGPGTVYDHDGTFTEDLRKRQVPLVGSGLGRLSFIHLEDAASATMLAIEGQQTGLFNIVDNEPVTLREFLPEFARMLNAPQPMRVPSQLGWLGAGSYGVYYMTKQRGASNEKARKELNWEPIYPTWREGFESEYGTPG